MVWSLCVCTQASGLETTWIHRTLTSSHNESTSATRRGEKPKRRVRLLYWRKMWSRWRKSGWKSCSSARSTTSMRLQSRNMNRLASHKSCCGRWRKHRRSYHTNRTLSAGRKFTTRRLTTTTSGAQPSIKRWLRAILSKSKKRWHKLTLINGGRISERRRSHFTTGRK